MIRKLSTQIISYSSTQYSNNIQLQEPQELFEGDTAIIAAVIFALFLVILFIVIRSFTKSKKTSEEIDTQPYKDIVHTTVSDDESEQGEETITEEVTLSLPDEKTTVISVQVGNPDTVPISGQRPDGIGWQIAGLTDVGIKRELNEDNMSMLEADIPGSGATGVYFVADGMGGHEGGEIASQLIVDTIQEQFNNHLPSLEPKQYNNWLENVVLAANKAVRNHQEDPDRKGKMGSTLVMAMVVASKAYIANVGDSRAYRINSKIKQISVDHSLVERLIQIGQITREEARTHHQRNIIYNTMGNKETVKVDLFQTDLKPNDRLLLCSDGLSGMITDEEILNISLSFPSPKQACHEMVKAAKTAGGADNITAIIVQMDDV